jgi:GNAT superfamily N-acetyltransferase
MPSSSPERVTRYIATRKHKVRSEDNVSDAHITMLEEAMANMLPPQDSMLCDGWLLRFTPGKSLNPNSVWSLYPGDESTERKIEFCERQYADRGLVCSFRLTEGANQESIEDILMHRGYRVHNPNQVLTNPSLGNYQEEVEEIDLEGWLETIGSIDPDMPSKTIEIKRGPLSRITLPAWYGLVSQDGQPCTYGRAVQQDDLFQLAELWTSPTLRSRGLGTRLIHGLLKLGIGAGATTAFMPVSLTNHGARRLYDRLGFKVVYDFRYLIPST